MNAEFLNDMRILSKRINKRIELINDAKDNLDYALQNDDLADEQDIINSLIDLQKELNKTLSTVKLMQRI